MMSYKSVSPQLKLSCYNCRYFQVSADLLNGMCFYKSAKEGMAAIGIGTCEQFAVKSDADFSWSNVLSKNSVEDVAPV